ncbi:Transcriptional regulator, TetR family [Modestobacter italicus]|uniref:Transcriptional regulator, TetR family n=1 Tax=Modestobacter italicus (strain DSM 44449 / CECT 9708 / BC 501) TaxID=2732864 RepID=I4ER07_MODI5|nr:TetR/AcrR family transcriptional regulator [Modestobacter marinus]CCH85820.1 Transcriptional regulator, TetR family [Modestobacter marinus]
MADAPSRRDDTRARIVDVAARLLREQGPAGVTTRGVAEAAGVQAPAIYRLFGDKDGLLDAVAEHVMATQVSSKAAVVQAASADGVDPLDDLRVGWDAQIEFGVANPGLFRLLSDPDRVVGSPAAQAGRQVLAARVHRVAATGRLKVSEQRAVDVVQAAGIGTILTLLSTPVEQRDAGLAASMYEAVLGQLLTDAPPPAEDGPMAIAVAFRAVAPGFDVLSEGEQRLLAEWLDRVVGATARTPSHP